MTNETTPQRQSKFRMVVALVGVLLVGAYGVYSIFGDKSNNQGGQSGQNKENTSGVNVGDVAAETGGISKKLSRGALKGFVVHKTRKKMPDLRFKDGKGKSLKLTDWKGKVVLVNLWATWCGPCRKEMPDLAEMQKKLGGDQFEVVAISVDRKGVEASGRFLLEAKATDLNLYIDKTNKVFSQLRAIGLPVTVLVDRNGNEAGRIVGPAKWNSVDAVRLLKTAIAEKL